MHFFAKLVAFLSSIPHFSNNLICYIHKLHTFKNNLFSVSCTTVDHPKSGTVSVSTDGTTSTATFTCVSGYKLIGEKIITCGEDGQWSDAIPYCGKICLQILLILDNKLSDRQLIHAMSQKLGLYI